MVTARSSLECRLYIELHSCACGGPAGEIDHRMVYRFDVLCALYEGRCADCGSKLEYLFALDAEISPVDKFGGSSPSTLIDAGQYMATAENSARQVRIGRPPHEAEQRRRARALMSRAVACIEEILKWIPEGADRVPEDAFFTADGRQVYAKEPARFRRVRLEAVLAVYREELLRLS